MRRMGPNAHGHLLYDRQDTDGAEPEAPLRAAIAAGSGHKHFDAQTWHDAHTNLGILQEERARGIVQSGGDLAAAAALYDECAQLWTIGLGADHEGTKTAQENAKRLRAKLAHGTGGAASGREGQGKGEGKHKEKKGGTKK